MNTIRFGFTLIGLAAATYGLVSLLLLGRADAVAAAVVFVVALLGWWATHRSGTHRQAAGLDPDDDDAFITVMRATSSSAPPWMKYHDEPYRGITDATLLHSPTADWTVIQGGKTRR